VEGEASELNEAVGLGDCDGDFELVAVAAEEEETVDAGEEDPEGERVGAGVWVGAGVGVGQYIAASGQVMLPENPGTVRDTPPHPRGQFTTEFSLVFEEGPTTMFNAAEASQLVRKQPAPSVNGDVACDDQTRLELTQRTEEELPQVMPYGAVAGKAVPL